MDIATAFLNVLQAGLTLWNNKEKTKYIDKLMSLKKDYYAEINKPLAERSDAVLDNVLFELRVLGVAFAAGIAKQDAAGLL